MTSEEHARAHTRLTFTVKNEYMNTAKICKWQICIWPSRFPLRCASESQMRAVGFNLPPLGGTHWDAHTHWFATEHTKQTLIAISLVNRISTEKTDNGRMKKRENEIEQRRNEKRNKIKKRKEKKTKNGEGADLKSRRNLVTLKWMAEGGGLGG